MSVSLYLYRHADLTVFRVLFAAASFAVALSICLHPAVFIDGASFRIMREIADWHWWVVMFTAHGALLSWRLTDNKARVVPALLINVYGFAIWFLYVALQDIALHYPLINNAAETVILVLSFVTIPATGTRPEVVTP